MGFQNLQDVGHGPGVEILVEGPDQGPTHSGTMRRLTWVVPGPQKLPPPFQTPSVAVVDILIRCLHNCFVNGNSRSKCQAKLLDGANGRDPITASSAERRE